MTGKRPMSGKQMVFGATGMLGQVLCPAMQARGGNVLAVGSARRPAQGLGVDLAQPGVAATLIRQEMPALVINCAALVDLQRCADAEALAKRINGDVVGEMADACGDIGARFVQISTDHFFIGDADRLHTEGEEPVLLNAYARTKRAGELAALTQPDSLVVRTNITGFRGYPNQPTFIEWALQALEEQEEITGFTDFYTSTLDARSFAEALLDLIGRGARGLYHLAADGAFSKHEFLTELARQLPGARARLLKGSAKSLSVARADSLGLDCERAFDLLGYRTAGLVAVVRNLLDARVRDQQAAGGYVIDQPS